MTKSPLKNAVWTAGHVFAFPIYSTDCGDDEGEQNGEPYSNATGCMPDGGEVAATPAAVFFRWPMTDSTAERLYARRLIARSCPFLACGNNLEAMVLWRVVSLIAQGPLAGSNDDAVERRPGLRLHGVNDGGQGAP